MSSFSMDIIIFVRTRYRCSWLHSDISSFFIKSMSFATVTDTSALSIQIKGCNIDTLLEWFYTHCTLIDFNGNGWIWTDADEEDGERDEREQEEKSILVLQQLVHSRNFMHACTSHRSWCFRLLIHATMPSLVISSVFGAVQLLYLLLPIQVALSFIRRQTHRIHFQLYISHSICNRSVYWHSVAIVSFIFGAIFILLEILTTEIDLSSIHYQIHFAAAPHP